MVFFLSFVSNSTASDSTIIDSLTIQLEKSTNASEKSDIYYALSLNSLQSDITQYAYYAQQGLEVAIQENYTTGQIKNTLLLVYVNIQQDSLKKATHLLNSLYLVDEKKWPPKQLASYYLYWGLINDISGDISEGIRYNLLGYDLSKANLDTSSMAIFLNNLSVLYSGSEAFENAINSQKEALYYFSLLKQADHITNYITTSNINLGNYFLALDQIDSAYLYLNTARSRLTKTKDYYGLINCYTNYGMLYKKLEVADSSIYYYQKSLSIFSNARRMDIVMATEVEVSLLEAIAEAYLAFNQPDSALSYIIKANQIANGVENKDGFRTLALSSSKIYAQLGKYDEALRFHEEYLTLLDENYRKENEKNVSNILLKHELKLSRINHETEMTLQNEQRFNIIVLFSFLTSLLIAISAYFFQRSKNHKQKSENEELLRINVELMNEKLNDDLDSKKRELTTKMIFLLKKNEFISSIYERLRDLTKSLNSANKNIMFSIVRDIKNMNEEDQWKEFEVLFQEVHTDFYQRLNTAFPNLTPNEIRMCAFLKLNLSIKEVASITYQSQESIKKARYRLRKKLELERDVNLVVFLNNL